VIDSAGKSWIDLILARPISYNTSSSKRLTRAWKKISKVVTTFKNSRAQNWTWSGSGFVRQTPSEKQIDAPKPSLLYKRARYYGPPLRG
jgi:hypothetical protein